MSDQQFPNDGIGATGIHNPIAEREDSSSDNHQESPQTQAHKQNTLHTTAEDPSHVAAASDQSDQASPTATPTIDLEPEPSQEIYPEVEAIPAGLPGLSIPANQDSAPKLAELEELSALTALDLEEQERQGYPARDGRMPRWYPEQYHRRWWTEQRNQSSGRRGARGDWGSSVGRDEPAGADSWDSGWGDRPVRATKYEADDWDAPASLGGDSKGPTVEPDNGGVEASRTGSSSEKSSEGKQEDHTEW